LIKSIPRSPPTIQDQQREGMKELNPQWIKAIKDLVNSSPYFQLESMMVFDLGLGTSRVEIEIQKKHLQPFGMIHGGVYSGLIDAAGFWAAYTLGEENQVLTTVEMKLNYLAPSNSGRLVGLGRCLKLGKTLGLAEARIENEDGQFLAHGLVTMMVVPDLQLKGAASTPPKFLG